MSMLRRASLQTPDAVFVPAASPAITYYGRWDVQPEEGCARAGQGAVYLRARFTGTFLTADLESPYEWWRVSIDDGPWRRFRPEGAGTILAAGVSPGTHRVTLIRSTEACTGISTFRGFAVEAGAELLPTDVHRARAIEFIGDSITAGAKNDGVDEEHPYVGMDNFYDVEDGNQSFAPKLARLLDAEFSVVARSGEGILHNSGEKWPGHEVHTADHYAWTFFHEERSKSNEQWDPAQFPVDAILIAIGTNDFTDPLRAPEQDEFTEAYTHLLETIRSLHPETPILCTEPVNYFVGRTAGLWIYDAITRLREQGVPNLYYIALNAGGPILGPDDYALDFTHPTQEGARKLAEYLKDPVADILGWK